MMHRSRMMLQLFKYERSSFRPFMPSAQTHVSADAVEQWIARTADASGLLNRVCVEIHGTKIPLTHMAEARVVAALFAADHNDYVTHNLRYQAEEPVGAEDAGSGDLETDTSSESDPDERYKLDAEYELNEDLEVNCFGPSHADFSNW